MQINFAKRTLRLVVTVWGPPISGKADLLETIAAGWDPAHRGEVESRRDGGDHKRLVELVLPGPWPFGLGSLTVQVELRACWGATPDWSEELLLRGVDGLLLMISPRPERLECNRDALEILTRRLDQPGLSGNLLECSADKFLADRAVFACKAFAGFPTPEQQVSTLDRWGLPVFEVQHGAGARAAFEAVVARVLSCLDRDFPPSWTCPSCRSSVPLRRSRCTTCGAKRPPPPPALAPAPTPPGSGS